MNKKPDLKVKVAIIGAGTAGMTAFREVQKVTDDWVMIHSGPFGTTCARVGCMPSKLFIQAANDFHRRHKWNELGLHGADQLSVDWPAVMKRVQTFRDRFVGGVLKTIDSISNKIIIHCNITA